MIFESVGRLLIVVLLTAVPFQADAKVQSSGALQDGTSAQRAGVGIELLTPTGGVDLNNYLHWVYMTTKKRWFANMPASVAKGQKGINTVEFRVLQDGSVPKEFMKMKLSSGHTDLDEASLKGIREAAPFAKLPEKFSQPYIELRFTFYYNLQPNS